MRKLRTAAGVSFAVATVLMTSTPASAQPDAVDPDVPILIIIPDATAGNCTFSMTPRSEVTMPALSSTAAEWGQLKVYNVSNCGTLAVRASVTDIGPGRVSRTAATLCTTTTGCTAKASQNVPYALGAPGVVSVHTQVTARGVSLCFDDEWSVVGGVSATYLAGGPTVC